jgi:hypothetical protein
MVWAQRSSLVPQCGFEHLKRLGAICHRLRSTVTSMSVHRICRSGAHIIHSPDVAQGRGHRVVVRSQRSLLHTQRILVLQQGVRMSPQLLRGKISRARSARTPCVEPASCVP